MWCLVHSIYDFFSCMTNWWLHIQNWHLVYVSCHFSIITNFYLSCVFLIHLGFVNTIKKLNYNLLCMTKHNKDIYISKYMDKRLSCLYVYGCSKIVVNVLKNKNTLFTHLWTLHSIYHHFFPQVTNGWLHIKNLHLIYVSHHFSTIINIVICHVFSIH